MHFPQGGVPGHRSCSGITPKWEQVKSVRTNGPRQDCGRVAQVSGSLPAARLWVKPAECPLSARDPPGLCALSSPTVGPLQDRSWPRGGSDLSSSKSVPCRGSSDSDLVSHVAPRAYGPLGYLSQCSGCSRVGRLGYSPTSVLPSCPGCPGLW